MIADEYKKEMTIGLGFGLMGKDLMVMGYGLYLGLS